MLNNINTKTLAFEYVLKNLLLWHKEANPINKENDISTLKAIKLLFFVSAVNAKEDSSYLLTNVFNHFVAMPYGHVESGIYDDIRRKKGTLDYYKINNHKTEERENVDLNQLDEIEEKTKSEILRSIGSLKSINFKLINLSAYSLVDLSHSWYSWQKYIAVAESQGSGSIEIPTEVIIQEDKIFNLEVF